MTFEIFLGAGLVCLVLFIVTTFPFTIKVSKGFPVTSKACLKVRLRAGGLAFLTIFLAQLAIITEPSSGFELSMSNLLPFLLCLMPCPSLSVIWIILIVVRCPHIVGE